jgi:hypothetical protein
MINKFKFNKIIFKAFTTNSDILPDHLVYKIPKYEKNPENIDFPWLIGGAPFLEMKVKLNNS